MRVPEDFGKGSTHGRTPHKHEGDTCACGAKFCDLPYGWGYYVPAGVKDGTLVPSGPDNMIGPCAE